MMTENSHNSREELLTLESIGSTTNVVQSLNLKAPLVYKKQEEGLLEHGCIMNQGALKDDQATFQVYTCNVCPDNPKNICFDCFFKCHAHEDESHKTLDEEIAYMKTTKCSCAMNNHCLKTKIKKNNTLLSRKSIVTSEDKACPLNEFFFKTSCQYFYFHKENESSRQEETSPHLTIKKHFRLDNEKRKKNFCLFCIGFCLKQMDFNHLQEIEENFEKVPKEKFQEEEIPVCACTNTVNHSPSYENINCVQHILDTTAYDYFFNRQHVPGIVLQQPKFVDLLTMPIKQFHRKILEDASLVQEEPLSKAYIASMELMKSFAICFPDDYFYINTHEVNETFNFDFLEKLFKTREVKNDSLFYIKTNCFYFYRKYYLMPRLVFLSNKEFGTYDNISVFHRTIFRFNINQFFECIEVKKERFFAFFDMIYEQIVNYFNKVDDNLYASLIMEYIKWIHLLISYRFDEADNAIIFGFTEKVFRIMNIVNQKKKFEDKIKWELERMVYSFMLAINDRFLFITLNKELRGKESEAPEKVKKMVSGYVFEKGEFQNNLVRSLFCFNKNINDPGNYLSINQFYDMLINEHDPFSESLKCIIESQQHYYDTEMLDYLFTDSRKDFKEKGIELFGSEDYHETEKYLEQLIDTKNQYYRSMMSSEQFVEFTAVTMNWIYNFVHKLFKQEMNQKIFYKQIFMIKSGYFDILLSILRVFETNTYFRKSQERVNFISEMIINIFTLLVKNNSFIAAVFFNSTTVSFLLNQKHMLKRVLQFYIKCIKTLKFTHTKIDFCFFTKKLRKLFIKEMKNERDIDMISKIFKSLKNCLKLSSDKSIESTCKIVSFLVKNILTSAEPFGGFGENLQNFGTSDESDYKVIIMNTFSLVNNLSDYYFYSMTDHIDIFNLEDIIILYEELTPKIWRIFAKTVLKYYVNRPYFIYKQMDVNLLKTDLMCNIDANLISRIDKKTLDLLLSDSINKDSQNLSTATDLRMRIKGMNKNNKRQINKSMSLLVGSNQDFDYGIFGLHPVVHILKKFKTMYKYYLDEKSFPKYSTFEESLNFKWKYYKEICLYPALCSIYKVVYFTKRVFADSKYLIYLIIVLFLQAQKYFFQTLLEDIYDLTSETEVIPAEVEVFLEKEFVFDKSEGIINSLRKWIDTLEEDVKLVNSEGFNQLDYFSLMKVFNKNTDFIKAIDEIKKYSGDTNNRFTLDRNHITGKDKLRMCLVKVYYDYLVKKKDFAETNAMAELFEIRLDPRISEIQRTVAIDLLYRLQNTSEKKNHITKLTEDNYLILESTIKLFKLHPELFQNLILEASSVMKPQIYAMISEELMSLFQVIFIEFTLLDNTRDFYAYDNFLNIIEFLRLLCENHNQFNQAFLFNFDIIKSSNTVFKDLLIKSDKKTETSFSVIDFIFMLSSLVVRHLRHSNKKKEFTKYLKSQKLNSHVYFNLLLSSLHAFYIELVQGSLPSNFNLLVKNKEFIKYLNVTNDLLREVDKEEYAHYLSCSFSFFNAFLEDSKNRQINKEKLIGSLNPTKMTSAFLSSFKKLIYVGKNAKSKEKVTYMALFLGEKATNDKSLQELENRESNVGVLESKSLAEDFSDFQVQDGDAENLRDLILSNLVDESDPLYILCSQIFVLFYRLSSTNMGKVYKKILNSFKVFAGELDSEDGEEVQKNIAENVSPNDQKLRKEAYLFFDKLIKSVDVMYKDPPKPDELTINKHKIFFQEEEKFLKVKREIDSFDYNTNKLNRVIFLNKPMYSFIYEADVDDFIVEGINQDPSLKLNFMLDYIAENMLPRMKSRLNLWKMKSNWINYFYQLDYKLHLKVSIVISLLVNILMVSYLYYSSVGNTEVLVDVVYNHIFCINLVHIIYLLVIILNWMTFQIFELRSSKESGEKVVTIASLTKILSDLHIFPLVWNFIWGFLGMWDLHLNFVYSLQLFSMLFIFPTMKVVVDSIMVRYKQFLSAGGLIIICCIFYGAISFYFLRGEFFNSDTNENICSSFFQCVVSIINFGIRSGSLGFSMKSVTDYLYWPEFIFDWIFYFTLILIMLNVINGIIVDTFQELRENNIEEFIMMYDTCFICNQNRNVFDIKGLDFEKHKTEVHSMTNYWYYIMKIKTTDQRDLNDIDLQIVNAINQRRTDFFPYKKSMDLMQLSDHNDGKDNDEEVEDLDDTEKKENMKVMMNYLNKIKGHINGEESKANKDLRSPPNTKKFINMSVLTNKSATSIIEAHQEESDKEGDVVTG